MAHAQERDLQGREIIHLEIGQPDFETPPAIAMAGIRAIVNGQTRYNPPAGLQALREAIAKDAGSRRNVRFTKEQVVIAPGAKPLILLSMMALLEPGDEVTTQTQVSRLYEAAIRLVEATPIEVPLVEEKGFDLDLNEFIARVNPKTRMIILNSPNNPTGGILSQESLTQIARATRRYDCWILADEIYARFVYGQAAPSIITLPGMSDRTILVDGFSKTYSMTGWRLGFALCLVIWQRKLNCCLPIQSVAQLPLPNMQGHRPYWVLKTKSRTCELNFNGDVM